MLAALAGVDGLFSLVEVQPFERFDHTTILAPGEPRGGRMPDASRATHLLPRRILG
jgi:hypothetical protein